MADPVSKDVLRRLDKLARLPEEATRTASALNVTRLTVIKQLCRVSGAAGRFATSLAQRVKERRLAKKGGNLSTEERLRHDKMIDDAVHVLELLPERPSEADRSRLWTLHRELSDEQQDYRRVHWGQVREIKDWDLLMVEYAVRTVLATDDEAAGWAYQFASRYADQYSPRYGSGLIPASKQYLVDIADFWLSEFGVTWEMLADLQKPKRTKGGSRAATTKRAPDKDPRFTHRQGQFLAFIHLYRKLHRQGPAEADLVDYFQTSAPAVHDMLKRLEALGLITRQPGTPRSARVAISKGEIPELNDEEQAL